MNPRLDELYAYPFSRLAELKRGLQPPAGLEPIALSIGEPKHAPPAFVADVLLANLDGFGRYPATRGGEPLRAAIADWIGRRFRAAVDHGCILPVNGTREALFAFAACVIDPADAGRARVLLPNPFYQIYEGAALLAGARPVYLACGEDHQFLPDLDAVEEDDWRHCQLFYACSPGNPAGAVWTRDMWRTLLEKADRYGFVIASDECYSELYFGRPPAGLLQICAELGRDDYRRCMVFNSLSKRSNLPGLRSGFVAGDATLIDAFLRYRTYHGSAMPEPVQAVSAAVWNDETHVAENRERYREKLDAVWPILRPVLDLPRPEAGFFLWPKVAGADDRFAAGLFQRQNVTVLPGSFLARDAAGGNPGSGRLRLALVAPRDDCVAAAERIRADLQR